MNWFLSILIGILTALASGLLAGTVAGLAASWYRVSSREGAAGFLVMGIALLGMIAGLIIGIVCARYVASSPAPSFLKGLGVALGWVTSLSVAALGICRLGADLPPKIDGRELELLVEIRAPAGWNKPPPEENYPAHAEVGLTRSTWQPHGEVHFKNVAPDEKGRRILEATVPLMTRASRKFLRVYFNKENIEIFPLNLRSNPKKSDMEWSPWVQQGWTSGQPRPAPDAGFFMRFRVQLEPLPPPQLTQDEWNAKQAAEAQARFEAVPADAPILTWLEYTKYGTPPERLAVAVKNITERPQFVSELLVVLRSADLETAKKALNLFQHLPAIPPELVAELSAQGKQMATEIHAFNQLPVDTDPGYEAAANIASRFHDWIDAARAVRKLSAGDLSPELHEILKLSRVRADSHAMRRDVCRVASFYMQQWTGLEPLPTDPKPSG